MIQLDVNKFLIEITGFDLKNMFKQVKRGNHLHCFCDLVSRDSSHSSEIYKCCTCDEIQIR